MLDIKLFRANPEMVKEKLAARNLETDVVDLLIDLDKKRRELLVQVEDLKALRNKKSEEIAILKRKREDVSDVIADMKHVSDEITTRDIEVKQIAEEINEKIIESLTLSLMRLLLAKMRMRTSKFVVLDK